MKRAYFVLISALILFAGCQPGAPSAPAGDAAAPDQSAAPAAAPAATPQPGAKLKFAVVPKGLTHQFWLTVKAGADAAGKDLGVEINWVGPEKETEVVKQINMIEDQIGAGVNAIVMAACDQDALVDVIKKALDKKIPVITIDSGVNSDLPNSFIATDNVAGAQAAARELAKLIGNEGEVGLIPFVKGAGTSEQREEGFKKGIAEFPNISIADIQYSQSDVIKAMNVTEDMLTAHPNLKGIFAANEPAAVGVVQALEAAGKGGQVKLVAFDAGDDEVAALKKGTIQALIVQNPFRMGYDGVKTAHDVLQGKTVEKRIDTGVTVVTMENFETPDVQKLLNPLK
ncbi:MAG: ABC transporter substrate-binding protein [Candidatus Hydrogenedentes bacterium]|nr:ABC transporter substrate-binding protein [Candidatus Hydrogenedentota bacterium]